MRKIIVFFLCLIAFLFCSCSIDISNQEYIEIARGYLIENFGGEYTFVSIKKTDVENEIYVLFKSENLDNQEVNVQVLISDEKVDSYTCHVASNYLSLIFYKEEAAYYEEFFKNYFTDCKVIMDNQERFLDFYAVEWGSDEINGEWVEHRNEINFQEYLNIIAHSKNAAYADVVVTDNNISIYIDSEDKLKCSLVDLQKANNKLDCDFYIVNDINGNYLENWTFKADVDVYEGMNDTFRYGYEIAKKEFF